MKIDETVTAKFIQTNSKEENRNSKAYDSSKIIWKQADIIEKTDDYLLHTALDLVNGSRLLVKRYFHGDLFSKEIEITRNLNHRNILMQIFSDDLSIYSELPSNGSIKQELKTFGKLNENLIRKIVIQILDALKYLHSQGIAHLGIISSNIFRDSYGTVKVSNFNKSKNFLIKKGRYLPGGEDFFKRDFFTLALLIMEMLTGKIGYDIHDDHYATCHYIDYSLNNIEGLSSDIKSFLTILRNINSLEKFKINKLINHPYLS